MENLIEPEGQTSSDNFSLSANQAEDNSFSSQSFWGNLSTDEQTYINKKGMKSPADLLKSYRALEKAYSSKISIPKDDDKEALQKFYSHLGMPDDSASFEVNFDEADEPLLNDFKQVCFDNHILPKSAQAIYDWFVLNRHQQTMQTEQAWFDNSQAEMIEQKNEWGAKADRNIELMKRGIRLFTDADDTAVDAIEHALGTKRMMQLFCRLGETVAEDSPVAFGAHSSQNSKADLTAYFREIFNA